MDAKPLNRRKYDRYFIDEIPVEGIGSIVEVSRKGLKIKKAPEFTAKNPTLNFNISTLEIKTEVRWEDKKFIGLQFSGAFNDPKFIIRRVKKLKETVVPPQMKVQDKAIEQYKRDEILTKLVSLIMEADCTEPNIRKMGIYIDEISGLEEIRQQTEEASKGNEEAGEESKAEDTKKDVQSLKNELIARAISSCADTQTHVADINFAINILGYDNVRTILRNYVRKRICQTQNAVSAFEDCESYDIIKSAIFRKLCHIFGSLDIQPEGNALLSCETVGVELLIRESSGILDNYYKSPYRLYSEVSRMYEKSLFGVDPIQINKFYFKKSMGAFEELYDGYVLAQITLNPHYSPSEDIKLSLAKNGLAFSYMAYLTFLTVNFLIDRDNESGFVLSKRLRGRGMDDKKILGFLDNAVNEAKAVLKDFGIKTSLARPPLPTGSFNIEAYLGRDIRFQYLLQSFRNFNNMKLKRMAIRYEDESYAHFILSKVLNAEGLGLNSKTFVVVPCGNVSDDQWYVRDFAYFDLLVFKDINKLPAFHINTFMKLWSSFEGQIIATFSNLDFTDFTKPPLYSVLNSHIVDFPSYFYNDTVYKKMVEHAVNYLKPYIGQEQIDITRYLGEIFTMNHIKRDVLLNKEIV
ncbi:MAG: hypothetical protein ABSB95_00410 [Dissulfurispiraceae bacterium]|jgi:hypothetical protein